MDRFICGGNKYTLEGSKTDVIRLPVNINNIPKTLDIDGYTLVPKVEFHISLVCIGKIIEKNNITDVSFIDKVLIDFCEFIKSNPIDLIGYRDEYLFVTKDDLRTIIRMCDVSNLNKFFDLLNKKYDLRLDYPPTHVTLYSTDENEGIFLTDNEDIKEHAKPINISLQIS